MAKSDTISRAEARAGRRFLELVADGVGPINAGVEVGWHPAKTKRMMKEPDFAEMVAVAQDQLIESVESALVAVAKKGNVRAQQFFLMNRASDRWRDVRHIEVGHTERLEVSVIAGVKEGVLEAIRSGGVRSLQPGREIVEAEVVDESG